MTRSRTTKRLLTTVFVVLALTTAAQCRIIRVSPTGSNANGGSSWAAAKQTVTGALAAAASGDEIWVAAGVYSERITLVPSTGLYGGFAGTETTRQQRNWNTNRSVLDGMRLGCVVDIPPSAGSTTIIDGFTIRNGMLGIWDEYGSTATISHNLITGNFPEDCVAAMCNCGAPYIYNNIIAGNAGGGMCNCVSIVVVGNTIVGNAGLAIEAATNPAIIENNIIAFNGYGVQGSGATTLRNNCIYNPRGYNYSGVSPGTGDISVDPQLAGWQLGDFHIQPYSPCYNCGWNGAQGISDMDMDGHSRILPTGGTVDIGAYESDGNVKVVGSVVVRVDGANGSDTNDGSTWALAKKTIGSAIDRASSYGGEVWVKAGTYNENITLKEYVSVYGGFAGNEATRDARSWVANTTVLDGGARNSVVTANIISPDATAIDGFTIRNGSATTGGGIYCWYASPIISRNIITQNSSSGNGGGISCNNLSQPLISNNLMRANSATANGGGIYCSGINDTHYSSPFVTCNTIAGNTAVAGGGIYCDLYCPSAISGNIVAFNSSGVCNSGGVPTLTDNDVYNPSGYNYSGLSAGGGDKQADPAFVSLSTGDYHIRSTSPCVDAGWTQATGVGTTDLDGNPRIQGQGVDMGAYESNGAVWITAISQAKKTAIGQYVQLSNKPITAAFAGAFYIEEPTRFGGLRVISSRTVTPGDYASVTGQLTTVGDEVAIQASSVSTTAGTPSDIPKALLTSSCAVGGGGFFWNGSNCGQQGMTGACGLSDIGLLVRAQGRVTEIGTGCLYIDDGSNWMQGNRAGDSAHVGVRIVCDQSSYHTGDCLCVTGISSCYTTSGNQTFACILTRGAGDIRKY